MASLDKGNARLSCQVSGRSWGLTQHLALTMHILPVCCVLQDGRQDIINTCLEEYEQIAVWVIVRNRQGNVVSIKFADEDIHNAV